MFDFDPAMIFEKVDKMSPEECKAFLTGGMCGLGLACMLFEEHEESKKKDKKEEKLKNKEPSKLGDFKKIRLSFDDFDEAKDVLEDLKGSLESSEDRYVTVKELYSLAGLPTNCMMSGWGWYNLDDCEIILLKDQCELWMPPASRIS